MITLSLFGGGRYQRHLDPTTRFYFNSEMWILMERMLNSLRAATLIKAVRKAGLALAGAVAATSERQQMAMPILPEAVPLAGDWMLDAGAGHCPVGLTLDTLPDANGWRLDDPEACVEKVGLAAVVGWRAAPSRLA